MRTNQFRYAVLAGLIKMYVPDRIRSESKFIF